MAICAWVVIVPLVGWIILQNNEWAQEKLNSLLPGGNKSAAVEGDEYHPVYDFCEYLNPDDSDTPIEALDAWRDLIKCFLQDSLGHNRDDLLEEVEFHSQPKSNPSKELIKLF